MNLQAEYLLPKRPLKDFSEKMARSVIDRRASESQRQPLKDFILPVNKITDKFLFTLSDPEQKKYYKKTIRNTSKNSYLGNYIFIKQFMPSSFINRQIDLGETILPDPIIQERIGGDGLPYYLADIIGNLQDGFSTTSNVTLRLVDDFVIENETETNEISFYFFGGILFVCENISDIILTLLVQVDKGDGNGFVNAFSSFSDNYSGSFEFGTIKNLSSITLGTLSFNSMNERDGSKIIEKGDKVRFLLNIYSSAGLLNLRADPRGDSIQDHWWLGGEFEFRTNFNYILFTQKGF